MFWRNKRVFLTGHTGFKGAWMAIWLQQLGADVTGYARQPNTMPNLFEMAHVADGMRSIIGDIGNLAHLRSALQESNAEVVFHLAAQSLVRYSYDHPVETYATNVLGTVHLLEAVRQTRGVRAVVIVTSDKAYENQEWPWGYRENDRMGGYDPYSNSKGCAELVTSAYRDSYFPAAFYEQHGVAVASARAGNVIGGGDWSDNRLIPDILKAFGENKPVSIRYPSAIRPWQHVLEPLSGYLMLAERLFNDGPSFAEGWNFGPYDRDVQPVHWIVSYMAKKWGNGATWMVDNADHPHEAQYLKLDCSKAHSRLNWFPRLHLTDALNWSMEWYRVYLEHADLKPITEKQIARYIDRMSMSRGAT